VFTRAAFLPEEVGKSTTDEEELMEVSVFELIEAFHRIVSQIDKKELMEIDLEKLSLTDIINEIMEQLSLTKSLTFEDLLKERKDRRRIIYTFLALLELIKLRMIKAYQTSAFGVIRIFPAVES
jgi:segregation and condensation protein A